MKLILAILSVSVFLSQGFAEVRPKFQDLIQLSVKSGARQDTQVGTYLILSSNLTEPNGKLSKRNYFSSVGFDIQKYFQVDHIEVVSELWTVDSNGNSIINQWNYVLTLSGDLKEAEHRIFTESPAREVIVDQVLRPDQAEISREWSTEISLLRDLFLK